LITIFAATRRLTRMVEIFSQSTVIRVQSFIRPPENPPFKRPARSAFHLRESSWILRFFVDPVRKCDAAGNIKLFYTSPDDHKANGKKLRKTTVMWTISFTSMIYA